MAMIIFEGEATGEGPIHAHARQGVGQDRLLVVVAHLHMEEVLGGHQSRLGVPIVQEVLEAREAVVQM
jgi:hypothetical protein